MTIYFYSARADYGFFSNFSDHGFMLDGHYWPTSEHYFQAKKFEGTKYEGMIRNAATPGKAARMGRNRKWPLRRDWESIKEHVMKRALKKKFETHPDIYEELMATDGQKLIENAPRDYYWGCGQDGSGKNRLGVLLMELRNDFVHKEQL